NKDKLISTSRQRLTTGFVFSRQHIGFVGRRKPYWKATWRESHVIPSRSPQQGQRPNHRRHEQGPNAVGQALVGSEEHRLPRERRERQAVSGHKHPLATPCRAFLEVLGNLQAMENPRWAG